MFRLRFLTAAALHGLLAADAGCFLLLLTADPGGLLPALPFLLLEPALFRLPGLIGGLLPGGLLPSGLGLLLFDGLPLQPCLLAQLVLLAEVAPGDAHDNEDQGGKQQNADEEVPQHGVNPGDESQEGGVGHVADGGHIHRAEILAVVDDGDRPQHVPDADGSRGRLLFQVEPQLQQLLVIGTGHQGLHRFRGLEDHMRGLEGIFHRDLLEIGLAAEEGGGAEVGEAPVQQPPALDKLHPDGIAPLVLRILRPQDHGDQGVALLFRGGAQAVARLAGAAGLDADGAAVDIAGILVPGQKTVGVEELPGIAHVGGSGVVSSGGDDLPEGGVGHALLGHAEDVPGGGVVIVVMEPVGVGEVGVLHAQLLRPLVHPLHESGDVPGHGDGQGVGGLIGGGYHQAVEQVVDGDLLSGLEVGGGGVLRHAHKGLLRHGDQSVHGQLAPADGLQGQQAGHDLCDAGGIPDIVGVLLVEDLAGVQVHQQGGFGLDGDLRYAGISDGGRTGDQEREEQDQRHGQPDGAGENIFHEINSVVDEKIIIHYTTNFPFATREL